MNEETKVAYCLDEVIELGDDPSKHLEEVAEHFQVPRALFDLQALLKMKDQLSLTKVSLVLPMFVNDPQIILEFNLKNFDVAIIKGENFPDGSWEKNLIGTTIRAAHMVNDSLNYDIVIPDNFTVQ